MEPASSVFKLTLCVEVAGTGFDAGSGGTLTGGGDETISFDAVVQM